MMLKHWIDELDAVARLLRRWEPEDETSKQVKAVLDSFFLEELKEVLPALLKEQTARRTEESQLETALCFADDAISIATSRGDIRLVNPAFERLTGYSGKEMVGSSHDRIWSSAPVKNMEEMIRTLDGGRNWRGELNCLTKEGELLITGVTAAPIFDHSGETTHYIFIQRDITARVRMEKELRAREGLLEKIINLTPNALMILDLDGNWKLDNLAAKTLLSDIGRDSMKILSTLLIKEIGGEAFINGRKTEITIKNNKVGHYLMRSERLPASYLMLEKDGEVYLVSLSDITDLEKRNREILAREKQILSSRMERALAGRELANSFIYRMRQPINVMKAIGNRMEWLLEVNDAEGLKNTLGRLKDELDLIEQDLLQFKKITKPEGPGSSPCGASDLLESMEILYGERCKEERVHLEVERPSADARLPLPGEMMQMLMGILMENALEALKAVKGAGENRIRIAFEDNGIEAAVAVEDSGPGIREEDRLRIFEPLHSSSPERHGLSLSLLHQVVDNSGGRVDVEKSELGGARLTIRFPR